MLKLLENYLSEEDGVERDMRILSMYIRLHIFLYPLLRRLCLSNALPFFQDRSATYAYTRFALNISALYQILNMLD